MEKAQLFTKGVSTYPLSICYFYFYFLSFYFFCGVSLSHLHKLYTVIHREWSEQRTRCVRRTHKKSRKGIINRRSHLYRHCVSGVWLCWHFLVVHQRYHRSKQLWRVTQFGQAVLRLRTRLVPLHLLQFYTVRWVFASELMEPIRPVEWIYFLTCSVRIVMAIFGHRDGQVLIAQVRSLVVVMVRLGPKQRVRAQRASVQWATITLPPFLPLLTLSSDGHRTMALSFAMEPPLLLV